MDSSNEMSIAQSVEALAIDPVCGMTVSLKTAAGSFEHNGQTYYFCSPHCVAKFQSKPETFLNKSAAPMMTQPVGMQRANLRKKRRASPVLCIRRSFATRRAVVLSAAWRSSRAQFHSMRKKVLNSRRCRAILGVRWTIDTTAHNWHE